MAGTHRLFYALTPDVEARRALSEAAELVDIRDGRRIQTEQLHLTLVFLGQVGDAELARLLEPPAALASLEAFELEISLCGWWRRSEVAWLAPIETPVALEHLHRGLTDHARDAGLEVRREAYRPHVTIGRKLRRAPRTRAPFAVRWRASDFALLESFTEPAGARYEIVAKWPLQGICSR